MTFDPKESKSLAEILGATRLNLLGGRTMPEHAAHWQERWDKGLGIHFPFGPRGSAPPQSAPLQALDRSPAATTLHLQRCGAPDRAAEVLVAPEERPALAAVRRWAAGSKSFLLLHGDPGVGKTVAACSALLAAVRVVTWDGGGAEQWDSGACAYVTAEDLARAGHYDTGAVKTLKFLADARWLVLDELGAEQASGPWLAALEALVDARYRRKERRTVLATNVSSKRVSANAVTGFEERYGARIARRIREAGQVVAV